MPKTVEELEALLNTANEKIDAWEFDLNMDAEKKETEITNSP